jgi:adenine-specific DNA-methyltransferase
LNPNTGKEYFPPKGSSWRANQNTMSIWLSENRVFFGKEGKGAPQLKRYLNEVQQGKVPITWWSYDDAGHNDSANRELGELFQTKTPFDTPKPTKLIKKILQIASKAQSKDIVLDFFAGSGTTAQAILELNKEDSGNRKFILVQLPEKCNEESEAYKAGYKTIADISKERIRRVIKKIEEENQRASAKSAGELSFTKSEIESASRLTKSEMDLGFKVFKLSSSNFKIWGGNEITEENLETQLDAFTDPVREGSETENVLYELILKAGYLLTDKIALRQAQGSKGFYDINDGELIIALEDVTQNVIDGIVSARPKKVIALDKLFNGNDQLKTNTVLQMRDAEIDFKTI